MQKPNASSVSMNSEQNAILESKLAEFAAGIGHELNNPLASIGGRVQLLMKTTNDEQLRRDLSEIYSEVRRAGDLIADIRLYACLPAPVMDNVNIAALLQSVVDFYSNLCSEKNIRLEFPQPLSTTIIKADYSQMNVLFSALIRNSMEALENDSREFDKHIDVSAALAGNDVEITVSDNGPGLTDEEKEHAFDPYYSARQANRGLGFGLCKAQKIVQMHDARITINSVLGKGTQVVVKLTASASE
ncbi:MAG: HAMP domain-containing histidine kinase [Thermoguttaceae bacterium]|nr:HAMP domain-containing histidine kinase [Thermoguttaceae bacterium]